jgi:putative acyl-CoA dehydrogenase
MPLNSIWEGAGNVMCLDVLRALARDARCIEALAAELSPARSGNAHLDAYVALLQQDLREPVQREDQARALTQRIALAVQGALLVCRGPEEAEAALGLAHGHFAGGAFGHLPSGMDYAGIIARAGQRNRLRSARSPVP